VNFSDALHLIKLGQKLSRMNWNNKNQFLQIQNPDTNSKMTLSYIFFTTFTGDRIPWVASQTDLLAEDWYDFDSSPAEAENTPATTAGGLPGTPA